MLLTSVQLNYLAMVFLLLFLRPSLAAWASVGYLPHAYMLTLTLMGFFLPKKRPPRDAAAVAASLPPGSAVAGVDEVVAEVPIEGITLPDAKEE